MMRALSTPALVLTMAALAGCISVPDILVSEQSPSKGWTGPLQELGLTGSIDLMPYPRNWRVKQVSSYDRAGGSEDDRYTEDQFDGGVVLADLKGPGAVLRIWTRNPWGTFYLYIDDMEHPLMVAPFEELFGGKLALSRGRFELFGPPFVGQEGGGYYSYVPIPYKERCRLVLMGDGDVLDYQITYAEFPVETPIRSFELTMDSGDVRFFKRWKASWTDYALRPMDEETEEMTRSTTLVWPESNVLVTSIDGPGVITEIEMRLDSIVPEALQKMWLSIRFDGQAEPGVLAPIGDLFGVTSPEAGNHQGVLLGNDDGRMWLRYPMPFSSFAEIRIINPLHQMADFEYKITWRPGPVDNMYPFFARYRRGESVEGQPYVVADLSGQGHFAGCLLNVSNADSLTFLDGDDRFIVDGAPASAYHGTGTDNYFNSGWYFSTGPFSTPTHGMSLKVSRAPASISAYRHQITESVPFNTSFRFELEHGTRNNQPGITYSSVAYWYQRQREPRLWPLPEFENLTLKL